MSKNRFEYIDDESLLSDIKMLMKIPTSRIALHHRIEEYKDTFAESIKEYRELEKMVDPVDLEKETEKKEESYKQINFEIEKIKKNWTVYPAIPQEIFNYIISQDYNPGEIRMEKFKLPGGKVIDLSFEMQSKDFITGSIKKCSEKKAKQKQKSTSKPVLLSTGGRSSENEDLKTFLAYLMNDEIFCNWMIIEFFERLKPLIDKGFFKRKSSNNSHI